MACVSREQLARLALGLGFGRADESAHVERCAACQADLDLMRSLVSQLAEAHRPLEEEHEESRARLLAALARAGTEPDPLKRSNNILARIGGLSMRQKLTLAAAAAVLLACGLIWSATVSNPAYAMGQVAQTIRRARSYVYTMTTEMSSPGEPGLASKKFLVNGRFYWLAPGSYRIETSVDQGPAPQDAVLILPAGKPGIEIDRNKKKFVRQPARLGQISPLMMVEKLSTYSGQADKLLGTKVIEGKTARGFAIEARKIDSDTYCGPTEIWIDVESSLPLLIRYEMNTSGVPATMQMTEFRWNVDLDPKLFDPVPPEGYSENARPPSSLDDQVQKIAMGLKLYAKYSGGHYPRVKMLYGDVTRDEFVKLSGAPYPPRKKEDSANPRLKEVYDAVWGFSTINTILRENADAAYHGRTVGPGDKDKVLLRWKLDDGTFSVIYGDLRCETVPPARLRVLEGQ
jgi:outer membrane lipoprotein-sorting protein